jgi:membrane-associated PAP2 superfamily phosphatase
MNASSRRPWWAWDLAVAAVAALSLLVWDATDGDLRVVQWFGAADGFAWQHRWLTEQGLHNGGRWLSLALLITVAVHLWRPLPLAPRMPRASRLWWLLATLACLVLIPFIKNRSLVSCPWDLAQFGGAARHIPHWARQAWVGLGDGGPGRCFPSGHASGAFSFVTGWFVLRGHSGRSARLWLAAIVTLGLVFGFGQVMRGAHYPSHVAWTAWICWAVSAALWHAAQPLLRGPRLRPLAPPALEPVPVRSRGLERYRPKRR